MDDEKIEQLWKSKNTILKVMQDRKIIVPKEEFVPFDEFLNQAHETDEKTFRENMTLLLSKKSGIQTMVFWPVEQKLGTDVVRYIHSVLLDNECKNAIVVIDICVTTYSKRTIKNLRSSGINIDVYTLKESQFNVMEHEYVPLHEICTASKKREVIKFYGLTDPKKLPHIKSTEVTIRHLGAKKGQLIKITRNSETQTGKMAICYRIVS